MSVEVRTQIIYPVRNEFDNSYPTMSVPLNYTLPDGWILQFPLEYRTDEANNIKIKYDMNSFKYEKGSWVDDIDYIRTVQKNKIAAVRWDKEREGIIFNECLISTSESAQTKINGAVSIAAIDSTYILEWKCEDGTFLELNAESIIALGRAVRDHLQAQFDKEKKYDILIDNKSTREEIEKIFWE